MRRHLNMGWTEWRALPWYEQRALRTGLVEEFSGVKHLDGAEGEDALREAGIQLD